MKRGDCVYTRQWWDPERGPEEFLQPNVAIVKDVSKSKKRCTLKFFVRPSQTRHNAKETFHAQEVLATTKEAEVSIDEVEGTCWVLEMDEYKRSDPAEIHKESDIYFCNRRYAPNTTKISQIKEWKELADGSPLKDPIPRATPRELQKYGHGQLVVGRAVTIDGVCTTFVADADVEIHIKNIVENPPAPVSIHNNPKGISRLARRTFDPLATAVFSEEHNASIQQVQDEEDPLSVTAMKSAAASYLDADDGFAGKDIYSFTNRETKRRRVDTAQAGDTGAASAGEGGAAVTEAAVGCRVRAHFPDQGWVLGEVLKVRPGKRHNQKLFVRYEDGDEGWADYPDEEGGFEVLGNHQASPTTKADVSRERTDSAQPVKSLHHARVKAHFPEEGWLYGTITKVFKRKKNNVFVEYDNGDEGWADYPDEGFEIVSHSAAGAKLGGRRSRRVLDEYSGRGDLEADNDEDDEDNATEVGDGPDEDSDSFGEDEEEHSFAAQDHRDDYFHLTKPSAKSKTSDRTLAKLDAATMDQAQIASILRDFVPSTKDEQEALILRQEKKFKSWTTYLKNGFNILCSGFGSKKELLMQFAFEKLKSTHTIVVVNGYFPSLSIKRVLKSMIEDSLGYNGAFRNVYDQVDFIQKHLQENDTPPYCLLIHNIDGATIRNKTSQTVLSMLADIPKVHIVASIDHINTPLMWDHAKLAKFNWVWQDCTTFASYSTETSYDNPLMANTSSLSLKGALVVMRSLTAHARKTFWILLNFQQDNHDVPDFRGLKFAHYLDMCRKDFTAHNDQRLRSYLTEFTDHKLVTIRKYDGIEFLMIPAAPSLLESITDIMKEHFSEDAPS